MGRFDPRARDYDDQDRNTGNSCSKRKRLSKEGEKEQGETENPQSNREKTSKKSRWGPRMEGNFQVQGQKIARGSITQSESSSSAPSEDSSDENVHEPTDQSHSVSNVIAPEQNESSFVKRGKIQLNSEEGVDDFDLEDPKTENLPLFEAEHQTAMEVSRLPIRKAAKLWDLAPFLVKNLEEDEYENFFPIQALVIPDVIASERHAHIRNRVREW